MEILETIFNDYINLMGAAQAQAAAAMVAKSDAPAFLCGKLAGQNRRPALALLARCAKKQAHRQWLNEQPAALFAPFLLDEDAKCRKNAAVLLGYLEDTAYVPYLIDALLKETQQFVRPSLILSLGSLGGAQARKILSGLPLPEGDDKHAREERDAIQKAQSRIMPIVRRTFTALPKPMEVWLAPVCGLDEVLAAEGNDKGIPLFMNNGYAACKTADYASLFRLRGFYEALLPIAAHVPTEPKAFAAALIKLKTYDLLFAMHEGAGAFGLRLEMRMDTADRGAFASEFFSALPKTKFVNAPSSYDVELRAVKDNDGATLMLRLFSFEDTRFAYRSEAVPASMHPAAAHAILYAHRDVLLPSHHVLDPFCGAGTLLAERAQIMAAASLTGLDISPAAWRIARNNLSQAGLHARVFNRDCRGFVPSEKVHEIICNLPFGHRAGNHEDNMKLYDDILTQWITLLHEDGFILAITNDKQLFERLAMRHKYRIVRRTPFAYGGLAPTCYLLKK